ncbi:hypothetical protein B296_00038983 [Ensete ventricosum]|uniref:Katanin p80 subunit C-terminal domain-containing protein n=1 Tax=Ensete ventricosum TaxID=4639 RepID=A0A426Z2C0_ENSVE|nr:hypothetical protein B296_00038983 [Ensete ventricosum]
MIIYNLTPVTRHHELQRIEPYAIASAANLNGHSESKSASSGNVSMQADNNIKSTMGRLSSSEPNAKETKPVAYVPDYLFWLSICPILFALHCRHLGVSLEMLLKLVEIFVPVIHSTLSAGPSVGVDLQAEKRFSFGVCRYDSTTIFSIHGRLERCNLCFIELEKIKNNISSLIR